MKYIHFLKFISYPVLRLYKISDLFFWSTSHNVLRLYIEYNRINQVITDSLSTTIWCSRCTLFKIVDFNKWGWAVHSDEWQGNKLHTLASDTNKWCGLRPLPRWWPWSQTASRRLGDWWPRCPRPLGRTRPGRRRPPYEESPGCVQ